VLLVRLRVLGVFRAQLTGLETDGAVAFSDDCLVSWIWCAEIQFNRVCNEFAVARPIVNGIVGVGSLGHFGRIC
jgi:hypothetical protein